MQMTNGPFKITICDPSDSSRKGIKALCSGSACVVLVRLKGNYHSLCLDKVPVVDLAFVDNVTQGAPNPTDSLAQITVIAVDHIGKYRSSSKRELRRVREYLPDLLGGLIHFSQARFIYIEVGSINPRTDHASLKFYPTDCQSAEELIDYAKNLSP